MKCRGLSIDSREEQQGKLFLALKGPNFDANQFALNALAKGAKYAVVDDVKLRGKSDRLLFVSDTQFALQRLAEIHRKNFLHPVFALTGSNGKTTTKELIAAVLATSYEVHATRGNFNNLIGLPHTVLNMPAETNFLVLEMGANAQGEIAALCEIGRPEFGLITNIGKAHLEGFGGIEGVVKGKGELFDFLSKTDGTAFVNIAQEHLEKIGRKVQRKVLFSSDFETASIGGDVEVRFTNSKPTIEFEIRWPNGGLIPVATKISGSYNFHNIISALTVGNYFGVPLEKMTSAIADFTPHSNRSQLREFSSNKVFMDAYNANPSSMKLSVTDFLETYTRPSLLILGDMLEVGIDSDIEHQKLVEDLLLDHTKFDEIWLVGNEFGKLAIQHPKLRYFSSAAAAKDFFKERVIQSYHIFLKGSRGIKLESIFD